MNSVKSYLWYLCLTTVFQVYPGEPVPAWFPSSICNWTESSGKSGTGFLQAGSPSRHPTNGVKAPKKSLRPMSHLQFYCEILSRDKVARQNRVIKSQVWHRSKHSLQLVTSPHPCYTHHHTEGHCSLFASSQHQLFVWYTETRKTAKLTCRVKKFSLRNHNHYRWCQSLQVSSRSW